MNKEISNLTEKFNKNSPIFSKVVGAYHCISVNKVEELYFMIKNF